MRKLLTLTFILLLPLAAFAQEAPPPVNLAEVNPLGANSLEGVIAMLIRVVFSLAGTAALAAYIYGGFMWMTSLGGDRKKKGTDAIKWATYGLVFILVAYTILNAVITALTKGTIT